MTMMMRKDYTNAILLIIMTFLSTFNTQNFVAALFGIEKVTIKNSLGPGITMKIQCKSRGVDLGEHYLSSDESFDWSFTVGWRTQFWCNLYWDNDSRYETIKVFDVDRQDHIFCKPKCAWKIKQDGAYCFRDREGSSASLKKFHRLYGW